ncbi:MAG: T9SS type A sorting domain-containing protein [Salinivirgaceae bacterium]|jgi:exo-beta-1,3-glucanase (GH17 family)|nr:T9SS type A sorting domain-containing protein [Salinivirgaceae bacterium]
MNRIILFLISVCLLLANAKTLKADVVSVSGRQILVSGSPYLIKGICYQPIPKGSTTISWATLTEDLALMQEAGINTIRVYSPIDNEDVLDEIDAAGIKIIMGFGYNNGGNYDILSGSFIDYINKYKNHNAILLWEFGNEYNYHPEWFSNDIVNWYTALNNAADEAHYEDDNHPTATAHGELPDAAARNACPDVDVWGMNIYRWDNPNANDNNLFDQWKNVSSKPMYLAETGGDRYMAATMNGYDEGENPRAQADANKSILNNIFNRQDICSGVTLFEFCDEWWKAGNPSVHDIGGIAPFSSGVPYDATANEEYWGIVDIDRNKTLAFEEVKTIYKSIQLSISNSSQESNILVYPNPSNHIVNIKILLANLVNRPYYISTISGQIITQGIIVDKTLQIPTLKSGFYNLVIDNEGIITSKKIIIY